MQPILFNCRADWVTDLEASGTMFRFWRALLWPLARMACFWKRILTLTRRFLTARTLGHLMRLNHCSHS
jgi:hypothetical protein